MNKLVNHYRVTDSHIIISANNISGSHPEKIDFDKSEVVHLPLNKIERCFFLSQFSEYYESSSLGKYKRTVQRTAFKILLDGKTLIFHNPSESLKFYEEVLSSWIKDEYLVAQHLENNSEYQKVKKNELKTIHTIDKGNSKLDTLSPHTTNIQIERALSDLCEEADIRDLSVLAKIYAEKNLLDKVAVLSAYIEKYLPNNEYVITSGEDVKAILDYMKINHDEMLIPDATNLKKTSHTLKLEECLKVIYAANIHKQLDLHDFNGEKVITHGELNALSIVNVFKNNNQKISLSNLWIHRGNINFSNVNSDDVIQFIGNFENPGLQIDLPKDAALEDMSNWLFSAVKQGSGDQFYTALNRTHLDFTHREMFLQAMSSQLALEESSISILKWGEDNIFIEGIIESAAEELINKLSNAVGEGYKKEHIDGLIDEITIYLRKEDNNEKHESSLNPFNML